MPFAETNGIRSYYERIGSGEPLALSGGSVFGRRNWAMAWDAFSAHFELISYDQRGYGRSDRPLERYTRTSGSTISRRCSTRSGSRRRTSPAPRWARWWRSPSPASTRNAASAW